MIFEHILQKMWHTYRSGLYLGGVGLSSSEKEFSTTLQGLLNKHVSEGVSDDKTRFKHGI